MLGTPRYMAPEQAAGRKDLTVAADVYSLGVILYERLTGQTPFTGDNALTLLRQVRESEPPRPSSIRPGLDRDLETVVLKCLEKEPAGGIRRPRPGRRPGPLARAASRSRPGRWARPSGSGGGARRNPVVAGLSASVIGLVLLGGSGLAYTAQSRAARRAALEQVVSKALDEATLLRGQAMAAPVDDLTKWPEALVSMQQARSLLAAGEPDAALQERVNHLQAALETEQAAAAQPCRRTRQGP